MSTITWDEVLKRTDLIGGDIETIEDGVAYRGPLSKIEADGDIIRFASPWCAKMSGGGWEKWDITSCFVAKDVQPQDIGDGRVHFSMPFLGYCTLFPKGGSKLDPNKVKNLPKNWERLLAMYPDLTFSDTVAEKVLIEKSWQCYLGILHELGPGATLRDLLRKFKFDASAEEFLWFYIEAVTGNKNVHEKVY